MNAYDLDREINKKGTKIHMIWGTFFTVFFYSQNIEK